MTNAFDMTSPPDPSSPTSGNSSNDNGPGPGWAGEGTNEPGDHPLPVPLPSPSDSSEGQTPAQPPASIHPMQSDSLNEHDKRCPWIPNEILQMIFDNFDPNDAQNRLSLLWALGRIPCMEGELFESHRTQWTGLYTTWLGIDTLGVCKGPIRMCVSGETCPSIRTTLSIPGATVVKPPIHGYWVCQQHAEDVRVEFNQKQFIDAQRVGTCHDHRQHFLRMYPDGYNGCTCERELDKWRCRLCYIRKRKSMIQNFQYRVGSPGLAQDSYRVSIKDPVLRTYWEDVRGTRSVLTDCHPCRSDYCQKREDQTDVMECRSCGGLIVHGAASPPTS